jgi:hypothetical protein
MLQCPIPKHPRETGVEEQCPGLAQIEGAHLLANEARAFLRDCGFGDCEILEWAETYIAQIGSGSLETFIAWIHQRQAA